MQHPRTGQVRFVMKHGKTRTIVADHDVIEQEPYCILRPKANSAKCLVWTAQDMSNNELCDESFALKFNGPELASIFAREFNKAKGLSSRRPNVLGGSNNTAAAELSATAAAAAAEADPIQVAISARPQAPGTAAGTGRCEAPCCDATVLPRDGEAAVACTARSAAELNKLPDGAGGFFATANTRSSDDRMLERLWQGIRDCQQRTMQVKERAQKADERAREADARARRAEEELDKMNQQQQQQKESELQQLVQRLLQQHSDNMLVESLQGDLDQERQQHCSFAAKAPFASAAVLLCCGVCFLVNRGVCSSLTHSPFFGFVARRI